MEDLTELLTEDEQRKRGEQLAKVLGLRAYNEDGWKEPRYRLEPGYGSKTALGLYRTVYNIVRDGLK